MNIIGLLTTVGDLLPLLGFLGKAALLALSFCKPTPKPPAPAIIHQTFNCGPNSNLMINNQTSTSCTCHTE